MSPRRIARWGDRHPFATIFIMFVLLLAFVSWRSEQKDDQLEELARCGQEYVEASNAATLPIREAAAELDAADDRVWHATQLILTQQAGPDDYRNLRREVKARNHLADELNDARKENPPPAPPETFCAER